MAQDVRDKGLRDVAGAPIRGHEMTWAPLEVAGGGWEASLRLINRMLSLEDCCETGSEGHREGVVLADSKCGVEMSPPPCPFLLPLVGSL